jgi:hypothetical protein
MQSKGFWSFLSSCRWGLALAAVSIPIVEGQDVTLTFDAPMHALLNARAWDQPQEQWTKKDDEFAFDAVHRFLLVRFPGSAGAIHRRLSEGYVLKKAELRLTWQKQEFRRVEGYSWRGYAVEKQDPPSWHASVHLLRRPWMADGEIGPTWNAYVNGGGYWHQGGARDPELDRYGDPLATEELSEAHPEARFDVTAAFTAADFGGDSSTRLRRAEDHGFLVRKTELANPELGEKGLCTGPARIWTATPTLTVTLAPRPEGVRPVPALPAAIDVQALATRLHAQPDGVPTTRVPERLAERAAELRESRRGDMPDWMWQRVTEVRDIPPHWGIDHGYDWYTHMVRAFDSGDPERYIAEIDRVLKMPPGWFAGHQHIEFILPLIEYGDLLPDVVRYHLAKGFEARWQRPLRPDKVFGHGKVLGMGTLNHMSNVRPKLLLGAQATGDEELERMAAQGLALLFRKMIFDDGFSQELGDSYYRGITLGPLQAAVKYAQDPLIRLKTELAVEKLLFEDICTYHPGLHRRVSRISRRMGANFPQSLLLDQDVAEAALHTMSRRGVLLHLDAPGLPPRIHDMDVFNFHATPPYRVAQVAPWGRPWETNGIDDKSLPFRAVFRTRCMRRTQEPIHATTYMGKHYALASVEAYTAGTVPAIATWKRCGEDADHLDDLSVLVIQGRVNEEAPSPNELTPFANLQHDRTLLHAMRPLERPFLLGKESIFDSVQKNGLTSIKSQASVFSFGPEDEREVWVNDRRVETFPARARHGDIITIREGVSYIGLLPLPATDLGRTDEVVIRRESSLLAIDSYLLRTEEPLPDTDATASLLRDATASWVVRMGDVADSGSFEQFRTELAAAQVTHRWDPEQRVLHLAFRSGTELLEAGVRTTFEREKLWHQQLNPSLVFAYRRANGEWPWLDEGIDFDSPLGQLGTAAQLGKGGATLRSAAGQKAFLRIDPVASIYEAVNPFIDPQPFELRTPQGVTLRSDGPFGLGRIVVQPATNGIWIDHRLPPQSGDPAEVWVQSNHPQFIPEGVDVATAGERAAKSLLATGLGGEPTVILNGTSLPGPFARETHDGTTWLRIPLQAPPTR